jgi:hypothetical protein
MKSKAPSQRFDRHDPNLLLAFLQYALADVRALSERSGHHLELAINILAEDTSIIDASEATIDLRRS